MNDLELIRKYYGEGMMHLCRALFSSILESEGLLYKIMSEHFAYNKFLYSDLKEQNAIEKFKEYIYSFVEKEETKKRNIKESPFSLMKKAGYKLYECKNESDIKRFQKYYAENEKLCTFNGGRLDDCYVFFAIKDNASEISREDFKNPKREDEYGISVISIQITKDNIHNVSIKNRYNSIVDNPDATYGNCLDNIIDGLKESFENYLKFHIDQNTIYNLDLKNYAKASDNKFYKYNNEIITTLYCPNNIIIDNLNVNNYYKEKSERYILLDYFILDLKEKTLKLYDKRINDSFIDFFSNIISIKISKNENKVLTILTSLGEAKITLDINNRIIEYTNNYITDIGSNFFSGNKVLKVLELNNVKTIDNKFLSENLYLEKLVIDNVESIGNDFLKKNISLRELIVPNVKNIGDNCLANNQIIDKVVCDKLENVGLNFLELRNKTKNSQSKIVLTFYKLLNKLGHFSLKKDNKYTGYSLDNKNYKI